LIKKILALMLLTSSVFGANEIYTWGYHDLVSESLIGLSMFLEQQDTNLMKIVFAFGLVMMMMSVLKQKTHSMIGFEFAKMLVLLLLAQNLFLKTANSSIHTYSVVDRVTGQTTTINKIPVGIGQTLSLFTTIEDAIMAKMEIAFSMPNSNSYRQAGLGFNLAAPMEIFKTKAANPWLEKTITAYIEDCKFKGDFQTGQDYSEMFYATDITTVLATQNHLLSYYYTASNPEGVLYDCSELWTLIENSVTSETANIMSSMAGRFGMNAVTFQDKSDVAMATMVNSTIGAQGNMFQAILRNTSLESVNKIAAATGMDISTLVRNKSVAEWSMTNDAILSTLQAQGIIPIMKAMVLVIIITISWILALLTIATLNPSYLKMFFILNLWLLLWGPLFLILNYAIDIMAANDIGSYGGAVTAQNQIDIFGALGAKISVLSKLVWAVPMLAFAIVKGSEHAMTSFIGGMGQGASAAVSGALQQQTRDAVMGRSDFLNLQTNQAGAVTPHGTQIKSNLSTQDGQVNKTQTGDNLEMQNLSTGTTVTTGDNRIQHDSKNLNASVTQAVETVGTKAHEKVEQTAGSLAQSWIDSGATVSQSGNTWQVTDKYGNTHAISKQDAEAYQEINAKALKEGYSSGVKNATSEERAKLETVASKLSGQIEGGASIGIGDIIKAGGKITKTNDGGVAISYGDKTLATFEAGSNFAKEYSASFQKSLSHQLSESQQASLALDRIHGVSNGRTDQDTKQTQDAIAETFSQAHSIKETLAEIAKNGESAQSNLLNTAMNNYIKSEGKNKGWFDENGSFKNDFVKEEASLTALKKDAELQKGEANLSEFLGKYGNLTKNAQDSQFKGFDSKMQQGESTKKEVEAEINNDKKNIEKSKPGSFDENGKLDAEKQKDNIEKQINPVEKTAETTFNAVKNNSSLRINSPETEEIQKLYWRGNPGLSASTIQGDLDASYDQNTNKYENKKDSLDEERKNSNFLALLDKVEGNELAVATAALLGAAGVKYAPQIRDAITEKLQGVSGDADEFAKVANEMDKAASDVEKAIKTGKGGAGTFDAFDSLGLAGAAEKSGFVFNKDGSIDEKATSIKQSGLRAEGKLEEIFAGTSEQSKKMSDIGREEFAKRIDEQIANTQDPKEIKELEALKKDTLDGKSISNKRMAEFGFGSGAAVDEPIKVGSTVQAFDNGHSNFGTVVGFNKDGTASVHFKNNTTGNEATVKIAQEDLKNVKSIPDKGNFDFGKAGANILASTPELNTQIDPKNFHTDASPLGAADDVKIGGGKVGAITTIVTMLGMGAVAANADENADGNLGQRAINTAFNQQEGAGFIQNTLNATDATISAFDPTIVGWQTAKETFSSVSTNIEQGNYGDATLDVVKAPVNFAQNVWTEGTNLGRTAHGVYDNWQQNQSVFDNATPEQLQATQGARQNLQDSPLLGRFGVASPLIKNFGGQ